MWLPSTSPRIYRARWRRKIARIKEAILSKCLITFKYYSEKGESERRIEPYRLIFRWFVLVYVRILPGQGGLPTFQIKSPLEIAALKRTLFAAGAFAGRSIVWRLLFLQCDTFESNFCRKRKISSDWRIRDRLLYRLRKRSAPWARFCKLRNMRQWIFSFGDKVEILSPSELIDDRIKQAEKIIGQNQKNRS